jgi:hypothetical protein
MLSEEQIKDWAAAVGQRPSLRLMAVEQKFATGIRRAKTHITFGTEGREYHIWVLPELDLLILDVLYKNSGVDEQLFRGEISAQTLETIEAKWFGVVRSNPARGEGTREVSEQS